MKQYSLLAILILLGFLFVFNALGFSSARHLHGQKVNQNELQVTRIDSSMLSQKEISDNHHLRKLGLGGKKAMVVGHSESSSDMESSKSDEKGAANSTISSDNEDINGASKKFIGSFPREGIVDQKKDKTPKAPRSSTSPSNTNSNSQISEEQPHQGALFSATAQQEEEEEERQNVVEAEEETENLIHMDYKGTARRKPPINNHEPRN